MANGIEIISVPLLTPRNSTAATNDGTWRPDLNFSRADALRITLSRVSGVTPDGYLRVPFRFQAPPLDTLGRPWTFDWETYKTLRAGEQARPAGKELDRFDLATMFVDDDFPWLAWRGAYDPQRFLQELRGIMNNAVRFRLVVAQPAVWGSKPLVNFIAGMVSITPEQRAGEVGTEYSAIEFLEVDTLTLQRTGSTAKATTHKLVKGDTLNSIARHSAWKRQSAWKDIAKANGMATQPALPGYVAPNSDDALKAWAKSHHKTSLKIPAPGS